MNPLQPAPSNAISLFNGQDLSNWHSREGGTAGWQVEDNMMTVVPKTGDIVSEAKFTDFQMHLEFRLPDMPDKTGQAKANSGVYLQGRYEIQVLDSYGLNIPGKGDCGAIYDQFAPLVNASKPALEWQTYDIAFRSARPEAGQNARITVFFNGILIQNNVEVLGPTGGAMDEQVSEPGPLLLQDHGDLVSYRNIWVVELPLKGSDTYEPR